MSPQNLEKVRLIFFVCAEVNTKIQMTNIWHIKHFLEAREVISKSQGIIELLQKVSDSVFNVSTDFDPTSSRKQTAQL